MAYTTADQSQLVQLFNLDREQLRDSSRLKALMDEQERFDADNGLTTVADVQALLAEIYDAGGLNEQLETAQGSDYSSLTVQGEYSVAFGGGSGSRATGISSKIGSRRARIRKLLEPDRLNLQLYGYWENLLLRQPKARVWSA